MNAALRRKEVRLDQRIGFRIEQSELEALMLYGEKIKINNKSALARSALIQFLEEKGYYSKKDDIATITNKSAHDKMKSLIKKKTSHNV